jgi:hypothetical protein
MSRHTALVSAAVLALGLAGSTPFADAATPTPAIHRHRVHQQERIGQGVRSGRLTPRETIRLERGQGHVARMIRRARADGVVTPRERSQILRAQGIQSRHIWRMKHNGRSC